MPRAFRYKFLDTNVHEEKMFPIIDDHIVVPSPATPPEYNIPLSKCDSKEKILDWVLQLLEKNWVTKELVEEFIKTAMNAHKLKRK